MKGESFLTPLLIMDQVFFRQPLKSNVIQFDNIFFDMYSSPRSVSCFSEGNSQVQTVSRNTIPVYCPECDCIPIDFD